MSNGPDELEALQRAWQNHTTELKEVPVEAILTEVDKFEASIRQRNQVEAIAALGLIPVFVIFIVQTNSWFDRAMFTETILALLFVLYMMRRHAGNLPRGPEAMSTQDYVQYQRRQLEHQMRMLKTSWAWYVMPLSIGIFGLFGGHLYQRAKVGSLDVFDFVPMAFGVVVTGSVLVLNQVVGVRKLKRELEALPVLEEE